MITLEERAALALHFQVKVRKGHLSDKKILPVWDSVKRKI